MPGSVPSTRHPVSYLALTDDLCSLSNAHPPYPVFILTFFHGKCQTDTKVEKHNGLLYPSPSSTRINTWSGLVHGYPRPRPLILRQLYPL